MMTNVYWVHSIVKESNILVPTHFKQAVVLEKANHSTTLFILLMVMSSKQNLNFSNAYFWLELINIINPND